ncbi:hypothetical protein [Thalassovita aquimarina]|uniref:Glycosyltransferase RgtA/B/C/D-like domain-containing protein n=1 Tax=Thalassovita aquimarina TaxID=2785917 RepID=A0ABS5HP43_9RHOB|nr:hypothetical protein [Thalassovita aquimarina]MBR9650353.1 hypothetical protein [Thalassovita aquimarina]
MTAREAQEPTAQRETVRAIWDRLSAEVLVLSREGIAGIVLLFVLLLVTRPYVGIVNDAMLYAVQGLHRIDGRLLGEDLFFRFGNQDSFSPFTRIYAPVIGLIGLAKAHALFWVAGLLAWLCGLIALIRAIFGKTYMGFAAAAAAILLNGYYGNLVLSYGEGFVTPRLFAESFGMAAIAAVVYRRMMQAGLLAVLAAMTHPITGAYFMAFCFWLALNDWRKFLLVGSFGAIAVATMAGFGVEPFVWIVDKYDPSWFNLLRERASMIFVLEWSWLNLFSGIMLPLVSLIIVSTRRNDRFARIALPAVGIPLALLLLSVFAVYVMQNKFLSAMQFWRALLILQLFGNLFALQAVMGLVPGFARTRALFAIAICYCVAERFTGNVTVGSAILSLASLIAYGVERGRNGDRPGIGVRVLTDLMGVLAVLITLPFLAGVPVMSWDPEAQVKFILRAGLVAVVVWQLFLTSPTRSPGRGLLVGGVCLAVALVTIDDRTRHQKFAETPAPPETDFVEHLRGRTVYWEGNLALLWFQYQLPSYYSCRQMGGVAFFRAQAFEFERRAAGLRGLNTDDFSEDRESTCPQKQDPGQRGPVETSQLQAACDALPDLDLLILRSGLPGGFAGTVELPVPAYAPVKTRDVFKKPSIEAETTLFHVYECADFRS